MIDENGRRNKFILVMVNEYDLGKDPTSKEFIEYTTTTQFLFTLEIQRRQWRRENDGGYSGIVCGVGI